MENARTVVTHLAKLGIDRSVELTADVFFKILENAKTSLNVTFLMSDGLRQTVFRFLQHKSGGLLRGE